MPDGVAIAIPTYNEIDNIQRLIPAIRLVCRQAEIFVVDDNSPDGTAGIVKEMMAVDAALHLISRTRKEGLSAAYLHAFRVILERQEIGFIVTMDADLSHSPTDLPRLLDACAGADLVIGSRYVLGGAIENWHFRRRVLSCYGNHYARCVAGVPIHDLTAGFVVYRRGILEKILAAGVSSSGYGYQIEMKCLALKLGGRILEVPTTFRDRGGGESKLERRTIWEGIVRPWRLRFRRGL